MAEAGYLYALINPSLEGLVKVGRTGRDPTHRVRELSSATGVPTPFLLAFDVFVDDAEAAESYLHALLERRGLRVSDRREFFDAPLNQVIRAMLEVETAFGNRPTETYEDPIYEADTSQPAPWQYLVDEAWSHYHGEGSILQDKKEAMKRFRQAARLGSPDAWHALGVMYRDGETGRPDPDEALECFKQGAQVGNDVCLAEMGLHYLQAGHADNARKCWGRYFRSEGFTARTTGREAQLAFGYLLGAVTLDLPLEYRDELMPLGKEIRAAARELERAAEPAEQERIRNTLRRAKRHLGLWI